MPDRRWTLSAESITAAAAVVAALIALAVGVWENVEQRRHNRLSVFPYLELVAQLHDTEHPDSVDRVVIRMINEGVGPAIVEDLRIRVEDRAGEEHVYDSWTAAREALESWGIQLGDRAELGDGTVLGVGREHALVTFEAPAEAQAGAALPFDRLFDRLGIVIVYRSIYGDEHRTTFGE